ncbi:MAG TPA: type IIL restriction-modification enzyme MmeI, partial [Dissulfurispiraceae bacterium]|nr:type IIL restriction-modification enzyme MmeI [Dissulfurispiraceae bacterium]
LVDAPDIVLPSRTDPQPGIPQMKKGSQPTDGGFLILTEDEKHDLLKKEPDAEKWLRVYMGGDELIYGTSRWCLWLKGISPMELKTLPKVLDRISHVRTARLKSPTKSVREYAAFPSLFTQDRQPTIDYLALPEVSSENRLFIPMTFLQHAVIASNKLQIVVGATLYHLGILSSTMHMAWVRSVAGRLESRYSYAPAVYNNFPWPDHPTEKQTTAIKEAAQQVLDTRAAHPESSLADLYDPVAMPPDLRKAHQTLDRAVDAAYGKKVFTSDAERVAFLFDLYQKYTSLLPAVEKKKKRTKKS